MTNHSYTTGALEMISKSSFEVDPGIFVYAQVRSIDSDAKHFLVTHDKDEITVVTTSARLNELDLIERNKDDYKLIALQVAVPFYSVGFLATVCDAFAKEQMNVLIVSTYSKDYLIVRADLIDNAINMLRNLGFNQNSK